MTDDAWTQLRHAAERARDHAYAPYSRFRVGAAIRGSDGSIFVGCNVENASYGATLCAERAALSAAVAAGARSFAGMVIVTDAEEPTPPCGICRQTLSELAGDLPIRSYAGGAEAHYVLPELLPAPFSARQLGRDE